jgi:uncharacterized protein YbgA (DUF1722 family)/uncharacterized protein YbbK (DUF523 family)
VSDERPHILVSRCLGFAACRYNGGVVAAPFVESLKPFVRVTTACPEVSIGLGVPRAPIRLVDVDGAARLIQSATGLDVSDAMRNFGEEFLAGAEDRYDGAILKAGSPSCGCRDVKVYASSERGSASRKGLGVFGGAVVARCALSPVEDEGRLRNSDLRGHFLTRLFARARSRAVASAGEIRDLVAFHARHKLLLMAYNQVGMRELGRLVANRERRTPMEVWTEYSRGFAAALARAPRRGSAVNVLMHALGYVSERLTPQERAFFLATLEDYRVGRVPLSVALRLMQAWIVRFDVPYLRDQVFFEPYPRELLDELDSGKGRDVR